MIKYFRKLYVKFLVRIGRAINIGRKNRYPANVISNMWDNEFTFDGVRCGSMEGFLQSLKKQDEEAQRTVCALRGKKAKREGSTNWRSSQTLYWKGRAIGRETEEYRELVSRAYQALYDQNRQFRAALVATGDKRFFHTHGGNDPKKTIMTEQELCTFLTELRKANVSDTQVKL